MSRTRMLKPDFFLSRSLAKVSRDARLLFQGLWCEADSVGRGKADARIVKGAVFPLDDDLTLDHIDSMLWELANTGHIVLYEVDEEPLFEVVNFEKHQAKSYRTGDPKHPGPDDKGATRAVCTTSHATCTPSHALSELKGREINDHPAPLHDDFERFWNQYPRKVGKAKAQTSWGRLNTADRADALAALPSHVRSWKDKDEQYIPHPTTWLNGRRWEDEVAEPKHKGPVYRNGIWIEPGVDL